MLGGVGTRVSIQSVNTVRRRSEQSCSAGLRCGLEPVPVGRFIGLDCNEGRFPSEVDDPLLFAKSALYMWGRTQRWKSDIGMHGGNTGRKQHDHLFVPICVCCCRSSLICFGECWGDDDWGLLRGLVLYWWGTKWVSKQWVCTVSDATGQTPL